MSKTKRITLGIVGVLLIISLVVGISYAAWRITLTQTNENTIATSCFNISFLEENNILLENVYPILDEDGKKLVPYTFTIKNNCEAYATYQVNLEIVNTSTLNSQNIKVMINEEEPIILNELTEGQVTLDDAKEAFILDTDALDKNEEKTYTLRVWIDENVTTETEGVQNSTWISKVTITASYIDHLPTDYEKCVANYGEDSINCQIIASVDETGACPTVYEDGTVQSKSAIEGGYVCSAPDDYGTSYYFRGTPENNWVKFAGYYWRILRINGDGSIRMIYAGDAGVIDALDSEIKAQVLSNGYDDSSTNYTQIGTSAYNSKWKKDNVEEIVNSSILSDNAGVGYMYGNRDGIVEGSTNTSEIYHPVTETLYYAKEYIYDAETDLFTLKDPVGLLGSKITEDYVGYYTLNSTSSASAKHNLYKITGVTASYGSISTSMKYSYVTYGTTSKEKAQENINNSTIKDSVDAWYETYLKDTEYESYISDTLFCNDRTTDYVGYGSLKTSYYWSGSFAFTNPRLICEQQNDRFTVKDTSIGNGDLTYSIGLITADEVSLAGKYNNNLSYYLYTGNTYWSMTSRRFYDGVADARFIAESGFDSTGLGVTANYGIRPVINLKANSLNSGTGSASNPYKILQSN